MGNIARSGRTFVIVVASIVLAGGLPARAMGQSGTGSLQGTVSDPQGAALPGAVVVLTDPATGAARQAVSNDVGAYGFLAVPPGTYTLKVELQGFRTAVVERVQLRVDSTTEQDVSLSLGSLTETVQVTAEPPLINTTDASIGNVIEGLQIRSLPMEGRNVVGLLSLQTGVTFIPTTNPNSTDPRFGAVSGSRADQGNVTLDGVDVNDQENQSAFTSVLRVTLDSVEEFRVTTTNYGADQGRSSGAQVSLVTRSGTNDFAGAGYWTNRDTRFSANEYFLKLTQVEAGLESKPPLLNKNIFGASIGGPIQRDHLFFFFNVEGLDEKREQVVTRDTPSASFRDGVLVYQCANAGACPGGTVQGVSGSHQIPAGSYGLSPAEIRQVDPLHIGPSQAALDYFNQFPLPNEAGNYPGNVDSLRFAAPLANTFRTYIARVDYKPGGQHNLFGRLTIMDDDVNGVPQYPGFDPNTTETTNNWGLALGHNWVLGSNKVNAFRYGYTAIDEDQLGNLDSNYVQFRFIDDLKAQTSSNGRQLVTQNFVDDFSWIKGDHTWKFGTNIRIVRNDFYDNSNSFHLATTNGSWVNGVGRVYMPGGDCPAPANCSGLPAVDEGAQSLYADMFIDLLGVVTQADAFYNYGIDGSLLPVGEPTRRLYGAEEYGFYAQDSWRVRDDLTVNLGLRYSLYSPPYEVNGVQVTPSVSLGEWFDQRGRNAAQGIPASASGRISFVPGGPKNGGRGYYDWDLDNVAPRVSAAWTVTDRTVVRGGYSIVYDRIGAGIATGFDSGGSFGLSTNLTSPVNTNNEDTPGIRFQGVDTLPPTLPAAPPAGFPATPGDAEGGITQAIDDTIVTPYSHVYNVAIGRELGRGFSIEAAYVGRRGRHQLVKRDLAIPSNLVDPASGVSYFDAARQLIDAYNAAGGNLSQIAPIAYWENVFPGAAGDGLTATQAVADLYGVFQPDYMTALYLLDRFCDPSCSRFGPSAYFGLQYDALAALSSVGRSQYDGLQLSLRKRFQDGYQFGVNYTYAVAKDHGSDVERGSAYTNAGAGGYSGFLLNPWKPDLNYSNSDYDVRHQVNTNWLVELPFGQGKPFGSNAGRLTNALIGDWSIAGLVRWTSGYPFNVINCRSCWTTNWNLQGNAELATPGQLPPTGRTKDAVQGKPSPFEDAQAAIDFFRRQYPGEVGIRNLLRGDGIFSIDLSVGKAWHMPFGHSLRFRWDIFNVTNTPRFNVSSLNVLPDRASSFGRYDSTYPICDGAAGRCMQANLRYEW